MKVRILGICEKCGEDLIKNSSGKTYCANCQTINAVNKFSKKGGEVYEFDREIKTSLETKKLTLLQAKL